MTGARVVLRVAIIGANGKLGGATVSALTGAGHEVTAVVRDAARADPDWTTAVADITKPQTLAPVVGEADVVINCSRGPLMFPRGEFMRVAAATVDLRDAMASTALLIMTGASACLATHPIVRVSNWLTGNGLRGRGEIEKALVTRDEPTLVIRAGPLRSPPAGGTPPPPDAGMLVSETGGEAAWALDGTLDMRLLAQVYRELLNYLPQELGGQILDIRGAPNTATAADIAAQIHALTTSSAET